jgi:hypothetical protein
MGGFLPGFFTGASPLHSKNRVFFLFLIVDAVECLFFYEKPVDCKAAGLLSSGGERSIDPPSGPALSLDLRDPLAKVSQKRIECLAGGTSLRRAIPAKPGQSKNHLIWH